MRALIATLADRFDVRYLIPTILDWMRGFSLIYINYVTVVSVQAPYARVQYKDGHITSLPFGTSVPIEGEVWRTRKILGDVEVLDDWAPQAG